VYHRARMFDAAIEDYCRSLELEPGIDYVQERRAMARLWSGDPQGAIDDLTDLLHRSPESPGGYAIRGLAWLRQDEVALAVCDLDRSLELRSDHLETSLYRSQAHYALGDLQAAQQDAEQALKLSPKYALLHDEVCLMVSMRGQLAWALWFYSWAQQAGYDLLLVCEGRGDALRVNGHFREAIENYDRCLPGADDPAATYLSRGWAWQGLGEDDRAAADFQRVLELSDHPGLCENARESLAELASMTKAG
jgi:tetratricopeptide (TPR) repeat protein